MWVGMHASTGYLGCVQGRSRAAISYAPPHTHTRALPPWPAEDACDAPVWRLSASMKGHSDDVYDISWAPDASALVSGSVDHTCILWDVDTKRSQVREGGGGGPGSVRVGVGGLRTDS